MKRSHIIYGLIDPITTQLRYVGYTSDKKTRYRSHLKRFYGNAHKENWIRSLLAQELKPEMIIIKEYDSAEELPMAEEYWYAFFISNGADLTNDPRFIGNKQSVVGPRIPWNKGKKMTKPAWNKGMKMSEEHRRINSESHLGVKPSAEARANQSKARTGTKNPNFGKSLTEEQKRKMVEGRRKVGPWNKGKKDANR